METNNYDIINKYFDLVQQEIKNLISEDKEIKPSQVEQFNAEIFNQPDEITSEIRNYIDKASTNNLDIKKVAEEIYNRFKLQIKNNVFNQKDAQNVPNPLLGERKHIKTFENFVYEGSYFHSIENIDEILDKISKSGYKSLDDSDRAILLNYSKDDEDIHEILVKMNDLTKKFKELNKKISVSFEEIDKVKLESLKKEWLNLNSKMVAYENMLRYLYRIEDPYPIWNYQKKHGLTASHED